MAANIFKIIGEQVTTVDEFNLRIIDNKISNVLFMPNIFEDPSGKYLKFVGTTFHQISFKDTHLIRCNFQDCVFKECIFLGCSLTKVEFNDCSFEDCNTNKMIFSEDSRLDPRSFDKNFDLINDTNIAIDLYRSLHDLARRTHQPQYARIALYNFNKSLERHNDYKHRKNEIVFSSYFWEKLKFRTHDLISGYGVKRHRIIIALIIYIFICGSINVYFKNSVFGFYDNGKEVVNGITDSVYFSFISFTTIGYGDIAPRTNLGKLVVMAESALGILMIAHGLNIFTNGDK